MRVRVERVPLTEPVQVACKLAEQERERALAALTPEARALVRRIEAQEEAELLGVEPEAA